MNEKLKATDIKTYAVRTLGCQMNVHDSERMAGLLDQAGIVPVELVPKRLHVQPKPVIKAQMC